jgi:hypothetical protein
MQWPLTLLALALPFVVASGIAPRTQAIPTGIVSLVGLRDNARPLLIFAPKPDDPQLEIQLRRTQQNATVLAERDVVVIAIPYNSPSTTPADASTSLQPTSPSSCSAKTVAKNFASPNPLPSTNSAKPLTPCDAPGGDALQATRLIDHGHDFPPP